MRQFLNSADNDFMELVRQPVFLLLLTGSVILSAKILFVSANFWLRPRRAELFEIFLAGPYSFASGDKLTLKTTSGEFSGPLTELHDAWWSSVAPAMA